MDRDLLRQSVIYHGESLLSLLTCEQEENPDFAAIRAELPNATYEGYVVNMKYLFKMFIRLKTWSTCLIAKNNVLYVSPMYLLICRKSLDASTSAIVEQFIARKADLLFAPSWNSAEPVDNAFQEESRGKATQL